MLESTTKFGRADSLWSVPKSYICYERRPVRSMQTSKSHLEVPSAFLQYHGHHKGESRLSLCRVVYMRTLKTIIAFNADFISSLKSTLSHSWKAIGLLGHSCIQRGQSSRSSLYRLVRNSSSSTRNINPGGSSNMELCSMVSDKKRRQ